MSKRLRSNLKVILDERGISIRQLSKDIEYRFESVRMLYKNSMDRLPVELLERICERLDIGIGELIEMIEDE